MLTYNTQAWQTHKQIFCHLPAAPASVHSASRQPNPNSAQVQLENKSLKRQLAQARGGTTKEAPQGFTEACQY